MSIPLTDLAYVAKLRPDKHKYGYCVTLIVSPGESVDKVLEEMRTAYAMALKIKGRDTRRNASAAISRIISKLLLFTETPPNGLVVFSGEGLEGIGSCGIFHKPLTPIPSELQGYELSTKGFTVDALEKWGGY